MCEAPFLVTDDLTAEPLPVTANTPRQVLVIDDEPALLSLVDIWLTDDPRCAAVIATSTAATAFVPLAENAPDTIICDFHLGATSSQDYLPGFRSAAPHARILVYTCDPAAAHRADVTARGADLVIDKLNVSLEQLVEVALSGPVAA
jgi:DNA-binding NarL/FixJ family response regulator